MVDPFESLDHVLNTLEEEVKIGEVKEEDGQPRPRRASTSSDVSSEEELATETAVTADDLDISAVQPVNQVGHQEAISTRNTPKSTFYFYQDTSGQLIFL